MDVFLIAHNDRTGILPALQDMGITNVAGSSLCGVPDRDFWLEEEVRHVGHAGLVIVVLNQELLTCKNCCREVDIAVRALSMPDIPGKKLFALMADPMAEPEFRSRWDLGCFSKTFCDVQALVDAVVKDLIESETIGGSERKIQMYLKAALLEDARQEAECLLQKTRALPEAFHFHKKENIIRAQLTLSQVYAAGKQHALFEAVCLEILELTRQNYPLRDTAELVQYRLLVFYESIQPDEAKAIQMRLQIQQSLNIREPEEGQLRRARLFFETADRLHEQYRKASAAGEAATDDIYQKIAAYIRSSVELFDALGQQAASEGFGECLKESYERLTNYCRIIGDREMEKMCVDWLHEFQQHSRRYQPSETEDARRNIKCIKAFLGKTLPDSQLYDVFISHKAADLELAHQIYSHLKSKGKEVFLDRISLPQLGDAEYRNSILSAIDNSSHLVLVCSNLEYLRAKWISEEYNLFCDELREGRKNGNIIMVFTEDVCRQVFASNKKMLPIQLRAFEIISFEEFRNTLDQFII